MLKSMENIFGSWLWPWSRQKSAQLSGDEIQTTTTVVATRDFGENDTAYKNNYYISGPEDDSLVNNLTAEKEKEVSRLSIPRSWSDTGSYGGDSNVESKLNCTSSKCNGVNLANSNSVINSESSSSEEGGFMKKLQKFTNLSDLTDSFQTHFDQLLQNLDLQQSSVPLDEKSGDPSNSNLFLPLPYQNPHHHRAHLLPTTTTTAAPLLSVQNASNYYHQISFLDNNNSVLQNDTNYNKIEIYNENLFLINNLLNSNSSSIFPLANATSPTNGTLATTTTWSAASAFDADTIQLVTMLATAIVLGVVILATVIGNVFVIAAILMERNLQSVANYLILSLAVADLLVACLVMPLSAVYEVSDEWRMGPELCDMWTSSDVLCCTASILHLVAIALDRYWAVTNIDYVHQRTAKRIGVMILVVWALSFLVSAAPLLGWKDPEWDERLHKELTCIVSQDIGYQIFATASSFYLPLLVILVLYWRIFQTARKRIRRRQQGKAIVQLMPKAFVTGLQPTPCGMIATAAGGSGGVAAAVVTVIGRPLPTISETTTAFTNLSSTNTSPEKGSYGNGVEKNKDRSNVENDPPTAELSIANYPSSAGATTTSVRTTISRRKNQNSADSKRERKAAKTLAIITGAFVCCWLPFFILAVLIPACDHCDISPLAMSFCLWLGYFNSTLNPIIYTIFSPEFRHAFKRLLCRRSRSGIRRRTRHGVRR